MSYVNETFLRLMARVESLKHRDEEEGAALAEYGLLIALIAVVAIGAVTAVGSSVNTKLQAVASAI